MKELKTYHLYHHQPDPLPLEAVEDRTWLINNAVGYSVVAVIQAPSATDALHAAECKAQARPLPRSTVVHVGNLFRETLPGDVLVGTTEAWMVDISRQLRTLSYAKSQSRQRLSQCSTIDDLAWSPDGRLLAVAENDRRVVLHTLEHTNAYPAAYTRGEYAAEHLAWSPDGTRLASGGYRGEVHIWRPAPWRTTGFHCGYTGSILICGTEEAVSSYDHLHCLAWTPDGSRIVAGREDGCLISWQASTGFGYRRTSRHEAAVTALAFSPREEHLLLSASLDTTVQIWDEVAEHEQVRFQHSQGVMAAVWSPNGRIIASCEKEDPTVWLWNARTGELLERLPLSMYTTHDLTIGTLAWSPDGRLLAAGGSDGAIQILDVALHQHVQTYWTDTLYRGVVNALAWSPDSTLLASGGASAVVNLWQVGPEKADATEEAAQTEVLVEEAS
jgi:WD40 repeat protein